MHGFLRVPLLIALLVISASAPAQQANGGHAGRERILTFASDILVRADAVLEVTETIRVMARGVEIRHGIYRDVLTRDGRRETSVNVLEVTRDGRRVTWRTEPIPDGVRVWIGDPDSLLTRGVHTYRIRYLSTRGFRRYPSHDGIYWDVTGDGWRLAIDRAQVRIRLPTQARFGVRMVYTLGDVSRAHAARLTVERAGDIGFRTTRRLDPGEGFTVSVDWPKGVLAAD